MRSVSTASVVENVEVIFMLSLTNPKWSAFEAVQITSLHLTQATLEAFAKSHLQVGGTNQCSSVRRPLRKRSITKGVARGGPGVPVTPPFTNLFLTKQPTTGGENAMTIPWPQ